MIHEHQAPLSERAWQRWWLPAFFGLLLLAGSFHLASVPGPWWDEGWTMQVARTWVERGVYGRLRDGEVVSGGLEAAFPFTASVALAYRLLGVGVWQARTVAMLYSLGAIAFLYALARRLYNPTVAAGTLVALFLLPFHPRANIIFLGRQVLAEPPMLCFLLGGYLALWAALRHHAAWLVAASALWALALVTKVQPLPFWLLSLLVPLVLALVGRQWRVALLLATGAVGTFLLMLALQAAVNGFLAQQGQPSSTAVQGLTQAVALVPQWVHRRYAVGVLFEAALPLVVGLLAVTWWEARGWWSARVTSPEGVVRQGLLAFAGSWLLWYLTLSYAFIIRYTFPPLFVASLFTAALLHRLTDGYRVRTTLLRLVRALRTFNLREALPPLVALWLVTVTAPFTLALVPLGFTAFKSDALPQAAEFLNHQTPPDARIETYDTELFLLLDRPYHYPTDQLHVEWLRHPEAATESLLFGYDPLASDPDFLVVGDFSRRWHLYDLVLRAGAFRLLRRVGHYEIYERAR